MAAIYQPNGKAKEYSTLAVNLYRGCGHGCVYCYAPACLKIHKDIFFSAPTPRKGIIDAIEKDAVKLPKNSGNVLLCFTCDPYQSIDDKYRLARSAINELNRYKVPMTILTKGGIRAIKDFDRLSENPLNEFAVTLTSDSESESLIWEPGAATPESRIESLKHAKKIGIKTWVSLEPVFNPDATIRLIESTHSFVDFYKVGKINYHPISKEINWSEFLKKAESTLNKFGKKFYIKQDLEKFRV